MIYCPRWLKKLKQNRLKTFEKEKLCFSSLLFSLLTESFISDTSHHQWCVHFFSHTKHYLTTIGCPTIHFTPDTISLELASDSTDE